MYKRPTEEIILELVRGIAVVARLSDLEVQQKSRGLSRLRESSKGIALETCSDGGDFQD